MGASGGMFFCMAEIGGLVGPLVKGAMVGLTRTSRLGTLFPSGFCLIIAVLTRFIDKKPVSAA